MKYVRKPLLVEAVKYSGTNLNEIKKFCSIDNQDGSITEQCLIENNQLYVINKGYVTPVNTNDYITKSIMNFFSVYSPEIFNYSFETSNYNQDIIDKFEKKTQEAPFQKERFEHNTNSAIDVNYMQGKYIVFKQQTFSVCFYKEQINHLKKIVDKIYETIENQQEPEVENGNNNILIENSKKGEVNTEQKDQEVDETKE